MTRPIVYTYEYVSDSIHEQEVIYRYADEIADMLLLRVTNAEEIRLLDRSDSYLKIAFEITVGEGGDIPGRVGHEVIWKFLKIKEAEKEVEKAKKVLEHLKR
jgi:hypothetical protein